MSGQRDYTARRAGYDLRKLRGKRLACKLGRTRRYHVLHPAARTIAALLALREQVIAPVAVFVEPAAQSSDRVGCSR